VGIAGLVFDFEPEPADLPEEELDAVDGADHVVTEDDW
jgi:hypothetical protein